jgi:hypothetical protein
VVVVGGGAPAPTGSTVLLVPSHTDRKAETTRCEGKF